MARTATKPKTDVAMQETPPESRALATTGPRTVAQERKEKLERIVHEIAKRADDYKPFLAVHGVSFEVFTSIIKQALIKNTDLLGCSTASVLQAALLCAKDGLMPDGRDAAIVPFKTTATYMPMYGGLLKIAYGLKDATGALVYRDVNMEVIYEGEEERFDYTAGTNPSVTFRPPLDRDTDKRIAGAFCVIHTSNGGQFIEVIGAKELGKIAAVGKAGGPRKAWPAEFAKKDVLRRLLKRTPKDDRLRQALDHDDDQRELVTAVEDAADAIPDSKLFDDTAHQVEDHSGAPNDMIRKGPSEAQVLEGVETARADLMAAETEAHLDEVIGKIEAAADFFGAEHTDTLMRNAEQLRKAKFGGAEGGVGNDDGVETNDAIDDDSDAEGLEGLSEAQDRLDAELAAAEETFNPVEARPTETASAQAAAPNPASSDSATPASSGSPAASSSSPDSLTPRGGGWKEAPAERRVTPAQAMLDGGVHFKAQTSVNAHGQLPYFNEDDEIVGWAKPDLDIPTRKPGEHVFTGRDGETATAQEIGTGAGMQMDATDLPRAAPEPDPQPEPEIRANPEDRQEPEHDDDGYGDDAPALVLRFKGHPDKPPREYADPVNWRDEIIFKMGSITKDGAIFKWWEDNLSFVEAAAQLDDPRVKLAVGKVVAQCVVRKLPGAAELVDKYGPFGK